MIGVSVTRTGKMASVLAQQKVRLGARVQRGIQAAATYVRDTSRALVPVDTKALWESATVRWKGVGLESHVIVGYGSYNFTISAYSPMEKKRVLRHPYEYAVYVHENQNQPHPNGGQCDFLWLAVSDLAGIRQVLNTVI